MPQTKLNILRALQETKNGEHQINKIGQGSFGSVYRILPMLIRDRQKAYVLLNK